jgi:hypothetical protein
MKRTTVNLLVDAAIAMLMLGMLTTGYILRIPLPPGTNKAYTLWGLTRHEWGSVHFWFSLFLVSIVVLHLALHWQWVVSTVARRFHVAVKAASSHLRSGVFTTGILLALLSTFAWLSHHSVQLITAPRADVCPPSDLGDYEERPGLGASTVAAQVPTSIQFWSNIYPIFQRSCLSCHGPARQRGGFRADQRDSFFGSADRPALIVAGKSTKSPLMDLVSGLRTDVPLRDRHKLSERDVALLQTWIDGGAQWPDVPP